MRIWNFTDLNYFQSLRQGLFLADPYVNYYVKSKNKGELDISRYRDLQYQQQPPSDLDDEKEDEQEKLMTLGLLFMGVLFVISLFRK